MVNQVNDSTIDSLSRDNSQIVSYSETRSPPKKRDKIQERALKDIEKIKSQKM
jgi:hypothetical protein